jgi:excisionase family DNA binding protein
MIETVVSTQPIAAHVSDTHVVVTLADGRIISTPLDWYPLLQKANPAQRNHIRLLDDGLHWPDLDEDLSIEGMLQGRAAVDKEMLVSEVASFFEVSEQAVYAAIRRGRLPAHKVGGTFKVRRSDATLWRASTRMGRPAGA